MGIFKRIFGREDRAQTETAVEDSLLKALLGSGAVTREMALQVPTIAGAVDLIANVVASTPIKLYREQDGRATEVKDDPRVRILNDETGDTLNANEFWKAITRDYYLGKGGYAYIRKTRGRFSGLFYVEENRVSIQKNTDPIFKDFNILVNGKSYLPFEFLKILRNTRDGASGVPITEENTKLIEAAYAGIVFERNMTRRGGSKRGFLKSEKRLGSNELDTLRDAFARMYGGDDSEAFVVLNAGVDFKEASNTSVEMQLNENKTTNAQEFSKLFHVSTDAISGKATDTETASLAKLAAIPLMTTIECALNKDFLLEKEKGSLYFAFDKKELLKGDMKSRFDAYKTALDANFMQIDEVRFAEDMEPLGLSWIRLGLQDVLYEPKTGTIYTPNTNQLSTMQTQTVQKTETQPNT